MTAAPPPNPAPGVLGRVLAGLGLSVAQLADRAGVNQATAHAAATGRTPRRPTAARMAATVGVTAPELFPALDTSPLAAELARQGRTARDVAQAAGVHENSVYAWLGGRYAPSVNSARRVAAALGVPAGRLFPDLTAPRHPTVLAVELARRGVTAKQIAAAAGVSRASVHNWAAGRTGPTGRHAHEVATALGMATRELFPAVASRPRSEAAGRSVQRASGVTPAPPGPPRPERHVPILDVAQVLSVSATGDPRWQQRAACADGTHDPELWWPHPSEDAAQARKVCAGCPVLGDCRDDYLATPGDRDGIWAGMRGGDLLAATRTPRARDRTALVRNLGWER